MRETPLFLLFLAALVVFCCGRSADANDLEARTLRVLRDLPRSKWDDPGPARDRRLARTARVISQWREVDAALLIALGEAESDFAGYVGAGCVDVPPGAPDCDKGKARSYWQAWRVACPQAWELPRGEAATAAFASCARRRFWGAVRRCRGRHPSGPLAGGFSGYAGRGCDWPGGTARAARYRRRLYDLARR